MSEYDRPIYEYNEQQIEELERLVKSLDAATSDPRLVKRTVRAMRGERDPDRTFLLQLTGWELSLVLGGLVAQLQNTHLEKKPLHDYLDLLHKIREATKAQEPRYREEE